MRSRVKHHSTGSQATRKQVKRERFMNIILGPHQYYSQSMNIHKDGRPTQLSVFERSLTGHVLRMVEDQAVEARVKLCG